VLALRFSTRELDSVPETGLDLLSPGLDLDLEPGELKVGAAFGLLSKE